MGITVIFVWVPAHIGFKGNEKADNAAKVATRREYIDVEVNMSKMEMRCMPRKRRDETIISRLRFGHTGLNSILFKIGKHKHWQM